MTVLLTLAGVLVGVLAGGVPGLLAGGAIGFLLGQQLGLRKRLKKVEETQTRVDEMQAWATEMKAWAKQTHAWLARLGRAAQSAESQPEVVTRPGVTRPGVTVGPDAEPEAQPHTEPGSGVGVAPVVRPVAAEPGGVVRAAVPSPATPTPPDPSTRAPRPSHPAAAGPAAGAREPAPTGATAGPSSTVRGDGGERSAPRAPSDPLSWLVNGMKRWVTTGNAPVKVGVLVSLVGVGLLLREAHRREIIELTVEVRLVAAALFGLVLLGIGWRQRRRRPVYGLSLQGGGIAVLYVTTYAAFAVSDVLPAAVAAVAVVAITLAAGVLSVVQDSRVLAVLGIIGGFLAPVLTYSQPEDHLYVFTFFAVLNAAIAGVAWFKTWPELNLLGFAFTFGLTFFWLSNRYEQGEWVAAQPFLALFVLMYMALPTLFAVREAPNLNRLGGGSPVADTESVQEARTTPLMLDTQFLREAWTRPRVAGTEFLRESWTMPLVFSTPFIGLGLQQLAIGHTEYGLAISAAALAVTQGALSITARRLGADRRGLAEAYVSLSVVFAAIAVPLALDAYFTSTVWTLQGLALMWLGCRRNGLLALIGGGLLQLLAAASFAEHLGESLPYPDDAAPLANEYFLGAFLLAVTGLVSGWLLQRRQRRHESDPAIAWIALAWGVGWWLGAGLMEIGYQAPDVHLPASLAFTAVSLGGAALLSRLVRWTDLNALGLVILPVLVVTLCVSLVRQSHPLDVWGWAAWPVSLFAYYLFLRLREGLFPQLSVALHAGGYWIVAVLAAFEIYWQVDSVAGGVWPPVAALATALSLVGAAMLARRRPTWPVAMHWRSYLTACTGPALAVIGIAVFVMVLASDGDPSPLPYLPLLNPVLVLGGAVLLLAFVWFRLAAAEGDGLVEPLSAGLRAATLAALGTVAVTTETARAVHHWLDVPWNLASLWGSTPLQASVSVIWAVIALSGMVAGMRLSRRSVWVASASWMAVVVAKLFLVDLSSLSAVGRVVSFIVVGVLLLIVGYLAPAPPAASDQSEEPDPAE